MTDLRDPNGPFVADVLADETKRRRRLEATASLPTRLRAAVETLTEDQLETPYRRGGWTARRLVHHLPDSHWNAYLRTKLAQTEDRPTIRPYDEARRAETAEAPHRPIAVSVDLPAAVHERCVRLLRSLAETDWACELVHPDIGVVSLDWMLHQSAWHGDHHLAHIASLRRRRDW